MIDKLLHSPLFLITLTVAAYFVSYKIYKKVKLAIFTPVLVSVVFIIPVLSSLDISFEEYYAANDIINFVLKLSVVTLGYLLYKNVKHIKGYEFSILISVFFGCVIGILSIIFMARAMGLDQNIIASLQPKSVTMPIALALSENSGGILPITTIAVIIVGIAGSLIGPWVLKILRIKDPIARGLSMGSGAHAVGTARAMEMGALEGAISGAAIGIMGVMTAVLLPIIEKIV
ncbi:MAG: LrgB family protein [Rikenellaceae bacterium]